MRRFRTRFPLGVVLAAALILPHMVANADDGDNESRAREVLTEAAATLAEHGTFKLEGVLTYRGEFAQDSEIMDTDYTLAFERPGAVSVHALNRDIEVYFYGNGEEVTRYLPEFGQYITEADDSTPHDLVAASGFELIAPALEVVAELVRGNPFDEEFPVSGLTYVGEKTWNEYVCDVVRFIANGYTYDVWVEKAPKRLVRRIEPDMKPLEQEYEDQYDIEFEFTIAAELNSWTLGGDVSELVTFTPPEGVEKVNAFQPPRPATPADELVGQAAPDFTLPLLDGGEITLADERGQIVILDFWATWCGPCRLAMPALETVSREFADEGVKLYGINLHEEPDQITAYLEGQGLQELTVALDRDGSVADLYRVDGIPQTVIVGPDGMIRIVHVGLWAMPPGEPTETAEEQERLFHNALADDLRKQLRGLLETASNSADAAGGRVR